MALTFTRRVCVAVLCLCASAVLAHEAPSTSPRKAAYILENLVLFDTEATRIDTETAKNVPALRFALQNNGPETLSRVMVAVYFFNQDGLRFHEEDYTPILPETQFAPGLNKPLGPFATYRMADGAYHYVDNLRDGWSGKVEFEIVDIDFAE